MPPSLGAPLNGHFRWFGPARPAEQVRRCGGAVLCTASGHVLGPAGCPAALIMCMLQKVNRWIFD